MNNKIMENIEIWKDIENYEGLYQVSNLGRVRSLERDVFFPNGTIIRHMEEKILAPYLDKDGYQIVSLYLNGKAKSIKVHRLVAEAFISNPENKPQVNHKDENPLNNCVDNLEWCTASYNNNYGTRTTRSIQTFKDNCKSGKIKWVKKVFCEELNKTFDYAKCAEEELGVCEQSIRACCRHEKNTAGGFHWRYAND